MIKILLVDDQKFIREQLKNYFQPATNLEVVGTAANSIEALAKIKTLRPHLVLMDVEMPGGVSGLELTSIISNLFPEVQVIILTGNYTEAYGQKAVRVGAGAYLPKSTAPEELIAAIKQVCQPNYALTSVNLSPPEQNFNNHKIVNYSASEQTLTTDANQVKFLVTSTKSPDLNHYQANRFDLFRFCRRGLIFNSLVWISAVLYLRFSPEIYTSQWGIKILSPDSAAEVISSNGETATLVPTPTERDSRNDYVYLANSPKLVAKAAALAKMSVESYQKPKITVDRQNSIIALQINGHSAEEAQSKAEAFHQTMIQHIEFLRQQELARQQALTQTKLAKAQEKLLAAQTKLALYQLESGISSDEHLKNLTDNLENLRQQQADLAAQPASAINRDQQLSPDLNHVAVITNSKADLLSGDDQHQESQPLYVQVNSTPTNSTVLDRDSLPSDLVTALESRTSETASELTAQIDTLEAQLRSMTQARLVADNLQRDLQVAEAMFTATLAQLDLQSETIDYLYPPLQLVSKPNLPEKPSNPNSHFVYLSGLMGSLLVTTGTAWFWFNQNKFNPNALNVID